MNYKKIERKFFDLVYDNKVKMTTYFYYLSANEIVEVFESILTYRDLKMYANDKFNGTYQVEVFYGESIDYEMVVLIRLNNKKGPEYFVEAARIVLQHHPNVKFVMAGSGDLQKPLIEKIARYKLGDKFFFIGFLNKQKLNDLLAITDVYCMPSVSEPFGLSAVS